MKKEKMFIKLDNNAWHGYESESLWVIPKEALYEIANIPFFAKNISLGDIVLAKAIGDKLWYIKTIVQSGHSTYRIFTLTNDIEEVLFFLELIQELGCTYERATSKLYSIDVPYTSNLTEVYKVLSLGEERKIWEFEEGHCGQTTV